MKKFLLTIEVDEKAMLRNMETNGLSEQTIERYVTNELDGWLEASGIRVHSIYSADPLSTDAGEITLIPYDDKIARGVQILLDGEAAVMLDVHNDDGESCVLIYTNGSDEPTECISLNQ